MPVTATASPTGAAAKPQERSIVNEPAMPTAAPAGATIESAVDAWLITNAWRKRSPGKRCHPRRRERHEVEHRRDGEDERVLPARAS